ncbi:MAG: hypothetical protein E4H33_01175 [Anaerolineales bacterium]|nr:MAG: hypothetical protein E4H33_01175 [Anaerolineales bacterium]
MPNKSAPTNREVIGSTTVHPISGMKNSGKIAGGRQRSYLLQSELQTRFLTREGFDHIWFP